jgi:hypothetical protein
LAFGRAEGEECGPEKFEFVDVRKIEPERTSVAHPEVDPISGEESEWSS